MYNETTNYMRNDMEPTTLDDLRGNEKNPRIMKNHDAEQLSASIKRFGDISGITFNLKLNRLVTGHQRVRTIKKDDPQATIQITQRFEQPTADGTVALGYVVSNGKTFPYRVVSWDEALDLAANIAANRVTGDFNNELLAEVTYDISQIDSSLLEATGQTQKEIDDLLKSVGGTGDEEEQASEDKEPKLTFKISAEQKAQIEAVIRYVKINQQITSGDEETQNGKALTHIVNEYVLAHPLPPEDEFAPPELPTE